MNIESEIAKQELGHAMATINAIIQHSTDARIIDAFLGRVEAMKKNARKAVLTIRYQEKSLAECSKIK